MNISIISFSFVFILIAGSSESIHPSTMTCKLDEAQERQHNEGKYLVYITHKNVHKFSGFLISEKDVLTAAHNLQEFWIENTIPWFEDYGVVVGSFNESIIGKRHSIEQVQAFKYYEYNDPKAPMDLALIRLKEPVEKSNFVDWIEISAHGSFRMWEGSFGWRWTSRKREGSSVQLSIPEKVEIKITKKQYCRGTSNANILCAYTLNPDFSLSEQDVGTPLIEDSTAKGVYSRNFKSSYFIYTAFSPAKIAQIRKMQKIPANIDYFLKFRAHGVPRALARWEQNHLQPRKKRRT